MSNTIKSRLTILFISLCAALNLAAQHYVVKGSVVNEHDQKPIELATVRLLKTDSTLVTGANTDSIGHFVLETGRSGNYILHASYVGCAPVTKNIHIAPTDETVDAGQLKLYSDDIMLRQAVIAGTLSRVEQKEDTSMFNAGAYRTPEGSTLEALVKQFPGMEIDDDGKIKWNGKEVKEFLINGKDFFKGDTETAMKNLPADLVSKIKAYDKKSDYAEQTGIDDGEETTVLDIMTKRQLNQSLVSNIDVAGGYDWKSHGLYSGRVFLTRFADHSRITFFANHNNVGDNGFGGPRRWGGNNGLTVSTQAGFNFSWENGLKKFDAKYLELGGGIFYNRNDITTESTSSSENYLTGSTKKSYSESHDWSNSLSNYLTAEFNIQWCPDSLTSLSFRPRYNFTKSESDRQSRSAQFDENPYDRIPSAETTDDVLDAVFKNVEAEIYYSPSRATVYDHVYAQDWIVNLKKSFSLSNSTKHEVSGNLNVTRRLTGRKGRNVSFRASGAWSSSQSENYSLSDIWTRTEQTYPGGTGYCLIPNGTHQFSDSPSINWNVNVGGSYVEPIAGGWMAEARYNFQHRFQDNNRSLYNLYTREEVLSGMLGDIPADAGTTDIINRVLQLNPADVEAAVLDLNNSQYATYHNNYHRASLGIRFTNKNINFSANLGVNPESSTMEYKKGEFETVTSRTVFNVAPFVRFRYNFSKTDRLEINYRGTSNQPSMTQLLPVADTSNPLNISAGNPNLDPTWNDNLRINLNTYNPDRQMGISAYATFNNNRRSITTRQITDEMTGVRYSRPENIDGNWGTWDGFMFNTGLGKEKLFTISSGTHFSYYRSVGYSSTMGQSTVKESDYATTYDFLNALFEESKGQSSKTTAGSLGLTERLDLGYRKNWWDVQLNGRINYQHNVTDAMNASNSDNYGFSYGLTGNIILDCGFSVSTDIRMDSRRGYSMASMNTNELIWNAQISQSFLKDKSLTLQVQFYDILRQQSNISRTVTALSRTDSWNDAINAYFMVHLIYKLNLFGGKKASADAAPPPPPGGRPGGGWGGRRF